MNKDRLLGQQVHSYRLVEEIGSGSFGKVYRGEHTLLKQTAALKFLLATGNDVQNEFFREAQMLKALQHPYILQVLDAGMHEGRPFIVTEYASGGSLRTYLQQKRIQLELQEALKLLMQIGQALHFTHQKGIVHRDLKPANVLFRAPGETLLADFGISILLTSLHTREINRMGTPAYMAPEQFDGYVSMKSDQYALGCMAYEFLTGRRPFVGPGPAELIFQQKEAQPIAPAQLNPSIPPRVEQAILKALAKKREERHQDVLAFLDALQNKASTPVARPAQTSSGARISQSNRANLAFKKSADFQAQRQFNEALACLEEALSYDPAFAVAWHIKGYVLDQLQKHAEALAAYDQALKLNFIDSEVYYNRGVAQGKMGKYTEAIAEYDHAIRLQPDYAKAYGNRGQILLKLDRFQEALADEEQAVKLVPDNPTFLFNRAWALDNLERYEEALAAYEAVLRLDPRDRDAYLYKGRVLTDLRRYEEALAVYEQDLKLHPNRTATLYHQARALYALGRQQEALASLDALLHIDPAHEYALALRKRFVDEEKEHRSESVDPAMEAYQQAQNFYKRSQMVETLEACERAMRANRIPVEVFTLKAMALRHQGKYIEALRALDPIRGEIPENIKLNLCLARLCVDTGTFRPALEHIQNVLTIDPDNTEAALILAHFYLLAQKHEQAITESRRVLKRDRTNLEAWCVVCRACAFTGAAQEALEKWCPIIDQLDPNSAEGHTTRGIVYAQLKDYEKALAEFEHALQLNPPFVERVLTYQNLAKMYEALERYQEVVQAYKEVIRLAPTDIEAYHQKARAHLHLKQDREALAMFEQILQLKPDDEHAQEGRRLMQGLLGQ